MKKVLVVLFSFLSMFFLTSFCSAETQTVGLNLGPIGTYHWPANGSTVGLIDANHDFAGMFGFETNIGQIQKVINVNIGGVTSEVGKGTPYGALDYTISKATASGILAKIGFQDVSFGGFLGYDFTIKDPILVKNCRIGFKLSTEIFSAITK